MLQIVEDFKAIVSPCNYCDNHPRRANGNESNFPDCCEVCTPVNNYLLMLGDLPFTPQPKNLHKLYPTEKASGYPGTLCTGPEFQRAKQKLTRLKNEHGYTNRKLAELIGISESAVSTTVRGAKTRMSAEIYQQIKKYRG